MNVEHDSNNQAYIELPIDGGHIRLTLIPNGWHGAETVRLQIRDGNGHLRQGPEIPKSSLGAMYAATLELLSQERS